MNKAEFTTQVKEQVHKIQDDMNIKPISFRAVINDTEGKQNSLNDAISELYVGYKHDVKYLALRSHIDFAGMGDSWIEVDFLQLFNKSYRDISDGLIESWELESQATLYTNGGDTVTILSDIYLGEWE